MDAKDFNSISRAGEMGNFNGKVRGQCNKVNRRLKALVAETRAGVLLINLGIIKYMYLQALKLMKGIFI